MARYSIRSISIENTVINANVVSYKRTQQQCQWKADKMESNMKRYGISEKKIVDENKVFPKLKLTFYNIRDLIRFELWLESQIKE